MPDELMIPQRHGFGKIFRVGKMLEQVSQELLSLAEEAGFDPEDDIGEAKDVTVMEDRTADEGMEPPEKMMRMMKEESFSLKDKRRRKQKGGNTGPMALILEIMKER